MRLISADPRRRASSLASCQSILASQVRVREDIYLALDGSATVYVNASVPALVALRGLPLDLNPRARLDRMEVRALFESPFAHVASVTGSRRDNRRYVHLRLEVPDVRRLGDAAPFAWSRYAFDRERRAGQVPPDARSRRRRVTSANVGWTGRELVAFRLHLPSRVPFHNSPSREIQRGNIIAWEQPLAERIKGQPIDIEVHMETRVDPGAHARRSSGSWCCSPP